MLNTYLASLMQHKHQHIWLAGIRAARRQNSKVRLRPHNLQRAPSANRRHSLQLKLLDNPAECDRGDADGFCIAQHDLQLPAGTKPQTGDLAMLQQLMQRPLA